MRLISTNTDPIGSLERDLAAYKKQEADPDWPERDKPRCRLVIALLEQSIKERA